MPAGEELSRVTEFDADCTAECRSLQASQQNVLLEGPEAAMNRVLEALMPHLLEPVLWNESGVPSEFRAGQRGTLIVRDVGALRADDQNQLLRWLDDSGHRLQIVSMSATPLFALVARGTFDANLYYRLNVMLVRVGLTAQNAVYADHSDAALDPMGQAP